MFCVALSRFDCFYMVFVYCDSSGAGYWIGSGNVIKEQPGVDAPGCLYVPLSFQGNGVR